MTVLKSIPKSGDIGFDVQLLQTTLLGEGVYRGKVDGVFGLKTAAAVSAFQKSKGLHGSGVIGPITLKLLGFVVDAHNPVTGQTAITKNLAGRNEKRNLHPTLRLMIEGVVFADGIIPECFKNGDIQACAEMVAEALESFDIREVGANHGIEVGYIQGIIGSYTKNGNGDQWCMSAVQCTVAFIEDYFQIESPLEDSEHCVTVYNSAKHIPGLVVPGKAVEGGFFIINYWPKTSGHTGYNKKLLPNNIMVTIEGNTGDNSVNDGDGMYEKKRDLAKLGSARLLGTVFIYPNNKLPLVG